MQLVHTAALQSASKLSRLQPHACAFPVAGDHLRVLAALLEAHPHVTGDSAMRQGQRTDGLPSAGLLLIADPLDPLLLWALLLSSEPFPGSQPGSGSWGPYLRTPTGWQLSGDTLSDLRGCLMDQRAARRDQAWCEITRPYARLRGVLQDLLTLPGTPGTLPPEHAPARTMVAGRRLPLAEYLGSLRPPR